jgi:hypothetical protein
MKIQDNGEKVDPVDIIVNTFNYSVNGIYRIIGLMTVAQMRIIVEAMHKLDVAIKTELEYRIQNK